MTKKRGYLFLTVLILSACTSPTISPAFQVTSTITPTVPDALTSTPTGITPVSTRTSRPSATPALSSSVTPTIDIASVITRTPAPPQDCPVPATVSLPDLSMDINDPSFLFSPREEKVLDYLNQGGNPSHLIAALRQTWSREEVFTKHEVIKDLTGDGVPELLIIPSELYIFGCQNNEYKLLMTKISESVTFNHITLQLVAIQDMNLNGIPEIVLANFGCGGMGSGQCLDVYIYEWDGNKLASLIPKWEGYEVGVSTVGGRMSEYLPDVRIQDVDQNGTLELILIGGIPNSWYSDYFYFAPWRDQIETYSWNGQYFIPLKTEFSPPVYRYQAVQDGDRAMLGHEYDKALAFYQEAIFNEDLVGWSAAHKDRSKILDEFTWDFDAKHKGTPTPAIPQNDPQEYPNLAAYARFRIMVLHILEGHMPEAQTVYKTLQEKFPEEKDGHGFALIAKAFWDEYQASESVKQACDQATSMAYKHQPGLKFLGADYHNLSQDIVYGPKDVCPFK
jgi:hypothetical protein